VTVPRSVFDVVVRHDPSPAKHSESTAAFLGRVAGDYWDQVRGLIEDWVSHVPADGRDDLIGRLRSNDTRQFQGAFWELYLHETFIRSGFEVTVHPVVDGTRRQPDFRVSGRRTSFYVEAKAMLGKGADVGPDARVQRLYDAVDKLDCPNFFLGITVRTVGSADLPTRKLRSKAEEWLSSLDPDETKHVSIYDPDRERFEWQEAGWDIELRPIPIRGDARGQSGHRPLGILGAQGAWINDSGALKAALEDKGSAYGDLDAPLIIAVNSFGFSSDEFDVMNALYGSLQVRFSLDDPTAPGESTRAPDGYWARDSWAHRHVAGVLIGRSVSPYSVSTSAPTLWRHPAASRGIAALPSWRAAEVIGDRIEYTDPTQPMSELFGLAAEWPVGDPFPCE
jgi:hypothetical protein